MSCTTDAEGPEIVPGQNSRPKVRQSSLVLNVRVSSYVSRRIRLQLRESVRAVCNVKPVRMKLKATRSSSSRKAVTNSSCLRPRKYGSRKVPSMRKPRKLARANTERRRSIPKRLRRVTSALPRSFSFSE